MSQETGLLILINPYPINFVFYWKCWFLRISTVSAESQV